MWYARFLSNIYLNTESGCYEWRKGKTLRPKASLLGIEKRAYIHVWEIEHGPVPPGLEICHSCDNPRCVTPAHLFAGTHAENFADMKRKGRSKRCGNRQAKGVAKVTKTQVIEMRGLAATGVSRKDLAAQFGLSYAGVVAIVTHRNWKVV